MRMKPYRGLFSQFSVTSSPIFWKKICWETGIPWLINLPIYQLKTWTISSHKSATTRGQSFFGLSLVLLDLQSKHMTLYGQVRFISHTYDSVFGKRVLTYWEIWGKYGNSRLQPDGWANSTHGKLYIFRKMMLSSFQKYMVFYAYHKPIHLPVIRIFPIFPVR